MIKAARTPGAHAHKVSNSVIMKEPKPLSMTANGGNMIANMTLTILMIFFFKG